ncbi:hypothetical protein WJN01_01190 [Flavobacteriaceae bacterium SZ-1-7]|uniref:hypothetical protein n=1 Tax=Tamlana sedimenti TaxID=3134126 RepID=UPI0031225C01
MKKIKYLLAYFVLGAVSFTCTDQSTFRNPSHHELEQGAFIRFSGNVMPATFEDAQNISFTSEVWDPNNNVIEYNLGITAIVGGVKYVADDIITLTSFPGTVTITSQLIADAIGVDVNTFGFGDQFNFLGTATRADGVVFNGLQPSYDDDTMSIGIGTTEAQLETPAYKNAMTFGTIISCPFNQADMIGTYTILQDDGFSATGNTQFEIIAGPTANQIILVNPYDSAGNFNITVDVTPLGIATFENQMGVLTEEICCAGYTPTYFESNAVVSIALSCIGYISLNFDTGLGLAGNPPTAFTFGPGKFVAQKN